MTDLILRRIVQQVLQETDEANPGVLAEEVARRIPASQVKAALRQALRLYVRQVISETRTSRNAPAPRPNRSAKVAAIRDGWQRRLHDRVHTGKGEWKLLGDCNYADLMAAAAERRLLADRNRAWAVQYETWANLLTDAEVATFRELPAETQMQALGSAA